MERVRERFLLINLLITGGFLFWSFSGCAAQRPVDELKSPYHGPLERGPGDLARALAEARRERIPITPAGIQAPLPEHNAAPLYLKLSRMRSSDQIEDWSRWGRAQQDPVHTNSADVEAARRIVQANAAQLRIAHQAASIPACVFRRQWSDGVWILLPEYAAMRSAERLLAVESFLLARQGRLAAAIRNQALGFRIAQHAASDPLFVAYLVADSCDAIALRGMETVLRVSAGRPDVVQSVRSVVLANFVKLDLARALAGELILTRATMNRVRHTKDLFRTVAEIGELSNADSDNSPLVQSGSGQLQEQGILHPHFLEYWADEGEATLIRDYINLIRAAHEPFLRRAAAFERIRDEIRARAKKETSGVVMWDHPDLFFEQLFGLTTPGADHETLVTARRRVLVAATEALSYHATRGAFPGDLSKVSGPTEIDPYTGTPLQYRRKGAGFVVYSRGPAGQAEGSTSNKGRGAIFLWPGPA